MDSKTICMLGVLALILALVYFGSQTEGYGGPVKRIGRIPHSDARTRCLERYRHALNSLPLHGNARAQAEHNALQAYRACLRLIRHTQFHRQ